MKELLTKYRWDAEMNLEYAQCTQCGKIYNAEFGEIEEIS
jgi:hypothetical protein